jgi:hypothetical protein
MPCYLVTDKEAKDGEPKGRLVEANNRASARNHVARDRFEVKQASPHDISDVIKGGGEIEVATGSGDDVEVEQQQPQGAGGDEEEPEAGKTGKAGK